MSDINFVTLMSVLFSVLSRLTLLYNKAETDVGENDKMMTKSISLINSR